MTTPNLETALRFVKAVEQGASDEAFSQFCHPDFTHQEYPNRLFPTGKVRDADACRESSKRGKQVLTAQHYEVRTTVASGDTVALEMDWTGTLAVPLGSVPVGGQLHARIGQFFTFRDGRIASIRNYDCYEPF
ncbi:nuclear transport factor 2 family protein [Hyalangium versicolor]|uniref:nuclear transport factor 2 family protein n=1 Tax=Hyalangium versicolor TaxID=2861190 RepID=UPI001CCFA2ED|nr:nuclear transport factor 2 family protein [Hyalangium versicolor]